jgi:hypothetical protein
MAEITLPYGYVTGRYLYVYADTGDDPDRDPDAKAAQGAIKLTPVAPARVVTNGAPATAIAQPVELKTDIEGFLVDPAGARGVYLVAGQYDVAFKFVGVTHPGFRIEVKTDHTPDNPLDLSTAAPITEGPQFKFVVNELVYTEALAARDAAVAAAAEATAPARELVDGLLDADLADRVPAILADSLAEVDTVARAAAVKAAELAQSDAGLLKGEPAPADWEWALMHDGNREVAIGRRTDGTYYPDALNPKADTGEGLDPRLETLRDDQGWRFAFAFDNDEVAFGQRTDGTFFPDSLGGAAPQAPTPVTIHGDSLTAGWASATSGLSALIGRAVTARGNGGLRSFWIAARQGGQPLRVTVPGDGTIPASGPVTVSIAYVPIVGTTKGGVASMSLDGVLAGVPGALAIVDETTATFTRHRAGRVTPVSAGSPFATGFDAREAYPIFWAGRNNFKLAGDDVQIVNDVRAMLAWTKHPDKALVLSIPPWGGEENGSGGRANLDRANNALAAAFPAIYEDTASRLRSRALLEAVGVTPTDEDIDNIANGLTPASFRSDAGHLNAKGYEALNLLVADIYTSRGLKP